MEAAAAEYEYYGGSVGPHERKAAAGCGRDHFVVDALLALLYDEEAAVAGGGDEAPPCLLQQRGHPWSQ